MVREYARLQDEPGYGRLYDFIRECCEGNLVIPPYEMIGQNLVIPTKKVGSYIRHMIEAGTIKTKGQHGTWFATWVATGKKSKPRGMAAIPLAPHPKDAKLHEAKNYLRRFYSNVFDSRVIGGPIGCIEVSGLGTLTAEQAFELARKKGWVG